METKNLSFAAAVARDVAGAFEPAGLEFEGWDQMEPHPDSPCGWIDRRTDRMVFVVDDNGLFIISPGGHDPSLKMLVKK